MNIDFSQKLLDEFGVVIPNVTLMSVCLGALNLVVKDQTPEQSFNQGMLIIKIRKAFPSGELESEEIALIKSKIKEVTSPVIMVQVCAMIEGKENPIPIKEN